MDSLCKAVIESLAHVETVEPAIKRQLVTCMDVDFGVLDLLQHNGVLSDQEIEEVKKSTRAYGRNQKLLDIILAKKRIQDLADALAQTKQYHLVAYLATRGEYDASYGEFWPLDEKQLKTIETNQTFLLSNIETTGLINKLVAEEVLSERQMEYIADQPTALKKNEFLLDLLKRGSKHHYQKLIKCLNETKQNHVADVLREAEIQASQVVTSETKLADLPFSLYRLILVKVYMKTLLVTETPENRHPEKGIYASLSEVCRFWHKTIYTKTFRDLLDNYFSEYFDRIGHRSAIVRNNLYYLSTTVRPKGLIDKLHHAECLTDDDTRYIKCLTYDHDKIDEMLHVVWDLSIEKYATYVDCLRQTGQHLAADIAETGGVTAKGKSVHEEFEGFEQIELKIVERLNNVRDKRMKRSPELEKELDFLLRLGIELLGAYHDKGIALWFWIHTEKGLEDMLQMRDDDKLEPWYENLFKIVSVWGEPIPGPHLKSEFVFMEGMQFHREMVNCPMTLKLISGLTLSPDKGPAQGVARLPNSLYVIHPKSIFVYQDEDPFKCLDEITHPDFGSLCDVSACPKTSCLYITDKENSCIWKVTPADRQATKWLPNVAVPFTSSVSGSGEVLVLRSGKPSLLEVYREDAELLLKLHLPNDDVVDPVHAVETRSGNYSILYRNALIEMTKNGVVTRRDKSIVEVEGALKEATHLALDIAERAYICEGDRIVLYDSQLVFDRIILDRRWILGPQRLCYIQDKKQIVIVHSEGRKVEVYNLRPRD